MFCPRCQAEYLPHVRHCSDCNVALVEQLPVAGDNPERERVSGFLFFRKNGALFVLPIMLLGLGLVLVSLVGNALQAQVASIVYQTGFVFLLVFCDTGSRGGPTQKGFSLGERAVRQKLPLLLVVHVCFLVAIFAGATGAVRLRRHTWFLWHLDPEYFDLISIIAGVALVFGEAYLFRGILERALNRMRKNPKIL